VIAGARRRSTRSRVTPSASMKSVSDPMVQVEVPS
jgi:hypothetical protein